MDDILHNPPKIQKATKKNEKEEEGVVLIEKTNSHLLGREKRWKYFIQNAYGQKEGFARSKRGALLKIKWWNIRQESGARKRTRKNITSLNSQEFLDLAGEEFPLRDYQEKTLIGQQIRKDLLLFSAESSRPLLHPRSNWVAGAVRLLRDKNQNKVLITEARSRRVAEKQALKIIKKDLAQEELLTLKESIKKGE